MIKKRFKRIYIEITNICNLNCSFCLPDNRKKEYITLENFDYILNQIKGYTKSIYLHVKGEPLMHPYINKLIELAFNKNFQVIITTNGTLIDNLKTKKIRQINYSLQSTNDTEKIKIIINKLKGFIKDTNIYLSLRLWSDESQTNGQLRKMLLDEFNTKTLEDRMKLDNNIYLSIEREFNWPDLNYDKQTDGYCYGLKDQIAILVDGTIVPCCLDHKGNIPLGNIYKNKLQEVLESDKVKNILIGFQNRKPTEELCKKCNFKDKF